MAGGHCMCMFQVQNKALLYFRAELPSIHQDAQDHMRFILSRLCDDYHAGRGSLRLLRPDELDWMRFKAAWHASPSEIHPADSESELIAGDLRYAWEQDLPVYIAWYTFSKARWLAARVLRMQPRLNLRFLFYVSPPDGVTGEHLHVFLLKGELQG